MKFEQDKVWVIEKLEGNFSCLWSISRVQFNSIIEASLFLVLPITPHWPPNRCTCLWPERLYLLLYNNVTVTWILTNYLVCDVTASHVWHSDMSHQFTSQSAIAHSTQESELFYFTQVQRHWDQWIRVNSLHICRQWYTQDTHCNIVMYGEYTHYTWPHTPTSHQYLISSVFFRLWFRWQMMSLLLLLVSQLDFSLNVFKYFLYSQCL